MFWCACFNGVTFGIMRHVAAGCDVIATMVLAIGLWENGAFCGEFSRMFPEVSEFGEIDSDYECRDVRQFPSVRYR